jgi:hypothetical protein
MARGQVVNSAAEVRGLGDGSDSLGRELHTRTVSRPRARYNVRRSQAPAIHFKKSFPGGSDTKTDAERLPTAYYDVVTDTFR